MITTPAVAWADVPGTASIDNNPSVTTPTEGTGGSNEQPTPGGGDATPSQGGVEHSTPNSSTQGSQTTTVTGGGSTPTVTFGTSTNSGSLDMSAHGDVPQPVTPSRTGLGGPRGDDTDTSRHHLSAGHDDAGGHGHIDPRRRWSSGQRTGGLRHSAGTQIPATVSAWLSTRW